jgi:hypothetical protein
MKRETAAITTKTSQSINASRERVPGTVVTPPRTVGRVILEIVRCVVLTRSITGAIFLLFCVATSASAYTVLANKLLQSNGSAADTQAALNAAPDGSTVQIPNGTHSWSSRVSLPGRAITLRGESIGGVLIVNNSNVDGVLTINKSLTGVVQVYGINFFSGSVSSAGPAGTLHHVAVYGPGQPVLMHDCTMWSTGGALVYSVVWGDNGGVIWDCTFDSLGNFAGGIQFKNPQDNTWKTPSSMGTADSSGTLNTYVENCTFKTSYLGCTDFDDDARVVIRYCSMQDSAHYSHGQDTSPWGARHWELYGNTYSYTASGSGSETVNGQKFTWTYPLNLQDWFTVRGGTGVIFGNSFAAIQFKGSAIQLNVYSINRASANIPCQTSYPAARQVGQSWIGAGGYAYANAPIDGTGYTTDPIYVWGNVGSAAGEPDFVSRFQYSPDDCGNGQQIENYVQAGRDYITGRAKPGYSPYPYPHPLRGLSPSPPTNLRIIE